MDRRLLLAIALSALVVIAYQEYLRIYYPQPVKPPGAPSNIASEERPPASPAMPPAAVPGTPPPLVADTAAARDAEPPVGDVRVATGVFEATFSSRGGRLVSLRLSKYRESIAPGSPGFQLVTPGLVEPPLGVVLRGEETWSDIDVAYEPSTTMLRLAGGKSGSLSFRGRLPGGAEIEKRFEFSGGRYDFRAQVVVRGGGSRYREVALSWVRKAADTASTYQFQGVEALVGKKIRHFEPDELDRGVVVPDPRTGEAAEVRWAGYSDTYFLSAILPEDGSGARLWAKRQAGGAISTEILVPAAAEPNAFVVYTGPKDLEILNEVGHGLARTIDLGWFGFVAEPMLRGLKLFHRLTGNYGLDIILLTILIKVLFIPLTHKSFESMQQLQKLQPEMKKLQERYKDDREALNKEVMELYRRHKVNPLGGCLPMLLQLPIFIGLYNALLSAVELRHAPFMLWINDLSSPDRLPPVPSDPLAVIAGWDVRIPVLTVLMGASMLLQQRMTPAAGDPMQQRMMMLMPLVFTVMFVNFPAGLVLYWLVNNILTIAQQAWMQRRK